MSERPHRKSYRLKGYDYSGPGLYFITICTKNREHHFGEIENNTMILNDIGKFANQCWLEIPNHFTNASLREYTVMPNHVHGIIELHENNTGRPVVGTSHVMSLPPSVMSLPPSVMSPPSSVMSPQPIMPASNQNQFGKPVPKSVSVIIQQFKSSVKRWCNQNGSEFFEWQPRFHDHIIRDDESYQRIAYYITSNVANWQEDKFYGNG